MTFPGKMSAWSAVGGSGPRDRWLWAVLQARVEWVGSKLPLTPHMDVGALVRQGRDSVEGWEDAWRESCFFELPEIVERYMAGEFSLDDFISYTMGLDKINEAFDLMHEGKSIRSVIHFDK